MNDQPMISQLGDPSMSPEQAAQAHAELNAKFGSGGPYSRHSKPSGDSVASGVVEPKIYTHAKDPDVPVMLYNAYRTARIHETGGEWVGKSWDQLSERKRRRFEFMAELFAESVGWDQ